MSPAITVRDLTKRFDKVHALTDGRLTVERGEIHALLGANGCGKSTLSKIVAGAYAPTSGTVQIDGKDVSFRSPRDAEQMGIALFYQELSLIPKMSVEANIFLRREPHNGLGFVDHGMMRSETLKLLAMFRDAIGDDIKADALVADLTPGQRQIVEICKVYAKNPSIVIMDEATAALDGRQVKVFFDILRQKREEGVSTIFISHRLDEVFEICDRATIMRNGAVVAETAIADTSTEEVVHMMVGDVKKAPKRAAAKKDGKQSMLCLEGVSGDLLRDVSLSVAPGEIVGLGGLQGQGQSTLLRSLFGALPISSGKVLLGNEAVSIRKPADAVRRKVAYVSGDRGPDAALPGRSIFENLAAAILVSEKRRLVRARDLRPQLAKVASAFKTKYARMSDAIGTLSGGNQQKIFIARWLATNPQLILLDDPTKGIDLAAKADLFALIRELADSGVAVLLYSSEESELLDNCDRIAVFNDGAVVTELSGAEMDSFHLTRAAYGEA
ncbi:sugar ABC transporter ATP-binding protein [uncultured Cohaesibacter sp.]|uniref:sugar ABC transporter ATP-binding protein n=1 Tax=uncultured Cohaesibacter sp. TaxID=1002546 RepID=UPI0029C8B96A|nr:sugar ABC transporter ATP-binding protein [uncultured Cohaesibacter sp.]